MMRLPAPVGRPPNSPRPALDSSNRVGWIVLVAVVAVVAGLPWAVRPWLGAVAGNLTARVARGLGYTALFGVLAVMVAVSRSAGRRFDHFEAFDQANWDRVRKSRQAPLWGDFVRI